MLQSVLGVVTAAALVLAGGVAASAEVPDTPEIAHADVSGAIGHRVSDRSALPVVESEIGRGAALTDVAGTTVALGDAVAGSDAALVRIAALSAPVDTRVLRAGAVPVLDVVAGASASTTVLLPLEDGAVQLWADAAVDVRIEVLAAFDSDPLLPGSMIALQEPVLRADTSAGLAGTVVGAAEVPVGVVGAGGVPSEDVRAVYATLVVDAPSPTTVIAGGQRLPVPAGRTTLTTIVAPDATGAVGLTADVDVAAQLYVTGWIPDEPPFASQVSLPGSFVVTADLTDGATVDLSEREPESVHITRHADAAYGLAVVAATGASETTLLDLGPAYEGRARGAVVDARRGAIPQLVLTAQSPDDVLTLRRGQASVSWAPVGDILGEEHVRPFDARPTVTIDSHDDGHDVDLGDHGFFTLSGALTAPGSSIDRVEISGPDGLIGTADVRSDEDGIHWEFGAAAPTDGSFTYTATVYDRAGHSAADDVVVDVVAVDADDTVTAPDVRVFNQDPRQQWLHQRGDTEALLDVEPDFAPGDVLIGAVPAGVDESAMGTPDGWLVRVVAIDRVAEGWRIAVEQAGLDEAFFQVDISETEQLDDGARMSVDDDPSAVAAPVDEAGVPIAYPEVEFADGDGERAWVATGSEVDLDDIAEDATGTGFAPASDVRPMAGDSVASGSMSMQANLLWEWKDGAKTPNIKEFSKKAATPEEAQRILDSEYTAASDMDSLTLALAMKAQVGADLEFVFRTHFTWEWGFSPVKIVVDDLTMKVIATVKGSLQLKASIATKVESVTWVPLGAFVLPTVTFLAGPLPVVITNDVLTSLKSSYGAEAKIALPEISWKRVYTYGFTYSTAKGFQTLSEEPKTTSKLGPFEGLNGLTLSASITAGVGPEIVASAKFYGALGGELVIGGQVKFEITAGVENVGHWRAFIQYKLLLALEMNGNVKLEFKLFGKKLELGKAKLFSYVLEIPIFTGRWTTDALSAAAAAGGGSSSPPGRITAV
ncbi:hypothetical protein AB0N73_11130 [Microbacterium sp. NPDC089189]|uniref:hypothetical protein n=1 Tax=Microbacterium sp. NPDC089189 TaxID=3154972 RepID=UPI00344327C1